jgi:glyoxylase-like metal-dependent hydrolase (beta-lactamase superfamily II)
VAHENVPALQKSAAERSAERNGPEVLERQAYADITYADSWSERIGNETVHMRYYGRAHTSGDSVIYFEEANVAHMGDLVFNRVHPFIDRGSGASIQNWIEVLRTTASDLPADAIYIFGHGSSESGITGGKGDLIHKSNFLEELLAYTQRGIDAGKSKEEITDLEALPGFEEFNAPGWGLTLSRDLSAAYDELTEG